MAIDPRHLIQLAAIAEAGSFAEAAERLRLAQSALSRNIKTLEERVGAPVLKRGRRGAVPTEIGAALAQFGGVIGSANRQATAIVTSVSSPRADQLRIGATHFIAENFLIEPLSEFMGKRPAVACSVQTGDIEELVEFVSMSESDLAIGQFSTLTKSRNLRVEPLIEDYLTVVARRDHPMARFNVLSNDALQAASWIVPRAEARLRWQIEGALRYIGISSIDVTYETSSVAVMIALLKRSDCIAMVPRFAISPLIRDRELVELLPDRSVPHRTIGILRHPGRRKSALVEQFRRELHKHARQAMARQARGR